MHALLNLTEEDVFYWNPNSHTNNITTLNQPNRKNSISSNENKFNS